MKFNELLEVSQSYRIKIKVVEAQEEFYSYLIGSKYDDYIVTSIECILEVGNPSPITNSVEVTPLLSVWIRKEKENEKEIHKM